MKVLIAGSPIHDKELINSIIAVCDNKVEIIIVDNSLPARGLGQFDDPIPIIMRETIKDIDLELRDNRTTFTKRKSKQQGFRQPSKY